LGLHEVLCAAQHRNSAAAAARTPTRDWNRRWACCRSRSWSIERIECVLVQAIEQALGTLALELNQKGLKANAQHWPYMLAAAP
jgi:hypothetical protein